MRSIALVIALVIALCAVSRAQTPPLPLPRGGGPWVRASVPPPPGMNRRGFTPVGIRTPEGTFAALGAAARPPRLVRGTTSPTSIGPAGAPPPPPSVFAVPVAPPSFQTPRGMMRFPDTTPQSQPRTLAIPGPAYPPPPARRDAPDTALPSGRVYLGSPCPSCLGRVEWRRQGLDVSGAAIGPPRPRDGAFPVGSLYARDYLQCSNCGSVTGESVVPLYPRAILTGITGRRAAGIIAASPSNPAFPVETMPDTIHALRGYSRCGVGGCSPSRVARGWATEWGADGAYRAGVRSCLSCGVTVGIVSGPDGFRADYAVGSPVFNRRPGDPRASHRAVARAARVGSLDAEAIMRGLPRANDSSPPFGAIPAPVPSVTVRSGR